MDAVVEDLWKKAKLVLHKENVFASQAMLETNVKNALKDFTWKVKVCLKTALTVVVIQMVLQMVIKDVML